MYHYKALYNVIRTTEKNFPSVKKNRFELVDFSSNLSKYLAFPLAFPWLNAFYAGFKPWKFSSTQVKLVFGVLSALLEIKNLEKKFQNLKNEKKFWKFFYDFYLVILVIFLKNGFPMCLFIQILLSHHTEFL